MRAVVTGGAGFIGSHLTERLVSQNFNVTILDNFSTGRLENIEHLKKNINIINCDLSVEGEWSRYLVDADYIFHLAALADIVPSIQNPVSYFNSNIVGTMNVLNASIKNRNLKKFVYSASSSCYGIAENYPTSEDCVIDTQYPYALTKRIGEELIMHWNKVYNLPCISLRLFNVYGTRSRTSGTYGAVFGVFLAQKIANKPLTIVGNGQQTRDFTYVTDVVEAMLMAADSKIENEIYNVGSGQTISVNTLASLISEGEPNIINIPERPGEPKCTFADIKKIKKELSWSPKVNIKEGVKKILDNLDYWKDAPVWTADTIDKETKDWFKYLGKK
tara:strand:- start:1002 stop:1997 length:996 start_codon:yes stop_codon:yes gene_type:complete